MTLFDQGTEEAAPLPPPVPPVNQLFGPVNLVSIWLVLLMLIPSVLVVPGVGAIGTPANLFGMAMAGYWGINRIRGNTNDHMGTQWAYVAFGVYLLGNAMAYIAAQLRGAGADESLFADRFFLSTFGLCGVALTVADGFTSRSDVDRLVRRLLVMMSIGSFFGAVQFFTNFDLVPYIKPPGLRINGDSQLTIVRDLSDFDRVSSTSAHPIEFGVVMAGIMPLAIHYAMFTTDPKWRTRVRWTLALIALGVPISIGRSSTITMIVGVLALMAVWNKRQVVQGLFIGVISIFVLRAAVPSLIGTIISLFTGLENDLSYTARTDDYAQAFTFIGLDPWFGRGPDTFDPATYLLLDNQILKSTIETGYFGVACLLGMVLIAMNVDRSVLSRAADDTTRHLGQALFASTAGLTITMFFADMLFFAQFAGLLFLMIGLAGALNRIKHQGPPEGEEDAPDVLRPTLRVDARPTDHI